MGEIVANRDLLATSLVARIPLGMAGVALLTLALARGLGPGIGGTAVGGYAVAVAVCSPLWGRRAQARGAGRTLPECAAGQVAACLGLAAAGSAPALYLGAAAALGATTPPLAAIMRSTWNHLYADRPETAGRFAVIESMNNEAVHICGRILVAGLTAAAAWVIPVAYLALAVGGTWRLSRDPRLAIAPPLERADNGSRIWNATNVAWAVAMLTLALSHGAAATAMVAESTPTGDWRGAATMAVWGVGSLLGGLVTLTRDDLASPRVTAFAGLAWFAAVALTLGLITGLPLVGSWVLILLLGAPISPTVSAVFRAVRPAVPAHRQVEAFAYLASLSFLGFALGSVAAGWTIQWSAVPGASFLLAGAFSLAAILPSTLARPPMPVPATA